MRTVSIVAAETRPTCPSCTPDTLCVACYLDVKAMARLEDEHELTLEGYNAAD